VSLEIADLSPAAVLSDLDGVLVDSGDSIEVTWGTWARSHGLDPELLRGRIHGRPSRDVIAEVAPHLDVAAEGAVIARMDIEGPPAKLLPGARELLSGAAGVPVAVVTSCPDALAHVRLTAVGLPVPAVLVTSDRVSAGKPDPEGYLLGAAELGLDAARCVVFEDAPAGVAAGAAAGAVVVGITTTHEPSELRAAGAIGTAASVAGALAALFGVAERRA
jgi:mannitol-1-/sugar-/sorbitol-6-phosphatase